MKQKVKEEFGRDLKIKYDKNLPDETDEELLALEADQVKDQQDLPGKDLKVSFFYLIFRSVLQVLTLITLNF